MSRAFKCDECGGVQPGEPHTVACNADPDAPLACHHYRDATHRQEHQALLDKAARADALATEVERLKDEIIDLKDEIEKRESADRVVQRIDAIAENAEVARLKEALRLANEDAERLAEAAGALSYYGCIVVRRGECACSTCEALAIYKARKQATARASAEGQQEAQEHGGMEVRDG